MTWLDGSSTARTQQELESRLDSRVFNVKAPQYGATGDGTTDDTTAIQAAATAWVAAQKGVLYFPAGHYKVSVSNLLTINYPGMSVEGAGQSATFIEPTSAVTGDLIRWQMNPWTVAPAGRIANITLAGASAGAGACGLHVGDLLCHRLDNVMVQEFDKTGSVGIHVNNVTEWVEKLCWTNVTAWRNKTGVIFDRNGGTSSWGYNRIESLWISALGTQTGMVFKNAGVYYSGILNVVGNIADTAIGIDVQDTCTINCNWSVAMETAHTTATMLKLASGSHLKGTGYIDTALGGASSTNLGSFNINFGGWFNVPGIQSSESLAALGTAGKFTGGITPGAGSAVISSGSGAPAFSTVNGSYYFRTDTPTVSLQRIYVYNSGTSAWIGIA